MEGLLPCPFCGKYEGDPDGTSGDWDEDLEIEEEESGKWTFFWVKCINCQTTGPKAVLTVANNTLKEKIRKLAMD